MRLKFCFHLEKIASTRLNLSKLKKDFINRELEHVHLRWKQVPRNESSALLLQLRVRKRKYDRHMYAQFRSRQDLNMRGKIPTDFESVALTTRPRPAGYKYCHYRIIFFLVFQKNEEWSAFDPPLLIHRRLDLHENNLQFRGIYIWKISIKHTLEISKSNNFMVS